MRPTSPATDSFMVVRVRSAKDSTRRLRVTDRPDPVIGSFVFEIDITATSRDIYIPLSVASGKKPAGFIYQIEGTAQGLIATTDISVKGEHITQITLGTLLFCKIPTGNTATFRIRVEMRGKLSASYGITLRQINYKFDPADARYQKTPHDMRSRMVTFR